MQINVYLATAVAMILGASFAYAQMRPQGLGSDSLVLIGSNGNTTSLLPGTVSTSFSLTLPNDGGTNGYVLQTNGSGVLSWVSPSSTGLPSGTIIPFAGANCPSGYIPANGASLSQSLRSTLFTAISTANGDGSTNASGATADSGCPAASGCFNVPDYRGRFLRGVDGGANKDPDRASRTPMAAGGNSGDNVGSVQGSQFASHGHNILSSASSGGAAVNVQNPGAVAFEASNNNSGIAYATNANTGGNAYIQASGGNETRPVNANVLYCVKL